MPIAEYAYNNTKNTSTGYIYYKFNCDFLLEVFYKKYVDLLSKSKVVDKLIAELSKLTNNCQKNLKHTQEFPKQHYDKH